MKRIDSLRTLCTTRRLLFPVLMALGLIITALAVGACAETQESATTGTAMSAVSPDAPGASATPTPSDTRDTSDDGQGVGSSGATATNGLQGGQQADSGVDPPAGSTGGVAQGHATGSSLGQDTGDSISTGTTSAVPSATQAPDTQAQGLTGTVTDFDTGRPLADAQVETGGLAARTGVDGRYTLSAHVGRGQQVNASKEGYFPARSIVRGEKAAGLWVCDIKMVSTSSPNAPPPPPRQ